MALTNKEEGIMNYDKKNGNNHGNNKALDVLVEKILSIVNKTNESLKFDKTFRSTVWKINTNGTYQIRYLGQPYNVYNALGTTLSLGQSVWVKIPSGVFRDMHICGIIHK